MRGRGEERRGEERRGFTTEAQRAQRGREGFDFGRGVERRGEE